MKQSPKLPADKRRSQLLKAAAKIFGRKGYIRATTEDIARAAKLTKGSLYFHFKSKEDIFLAVVKELHKAHTDAIMEILEIEKDPVQAIEKSIRIVLAVHQEFRYINPVFWQQAGSLPVVRNYMREQHNTMQNQVVRYLNKNSEVPKADAELFFMVLHTSIDGMILHVSGGMHELDQERFIQAMVTIVKLFINENKNNK